MKGRPEAMTEEIQNRGVDSLDTPALELGDLSMRKMLSMDGHQVDSIVQRLVRLARNPVPSMGFDDGDSGFRYSSVKPHQARESIRVTKQTIDAIESAQEKFTEPDVEEDDDSGEDAGDQVD